MKFRPLTTEELQPLEKEMVIFLATQGIMAEDWVKMQQDQPEKAQNLLDNFIETVWLTIFTSKRYLESHHDSSTTYYDFTPEKLHAIKMEKLPNSDQYNIGFQTVDYKISREEDMFSLMQSGAQFCDGKAYKEACLLWASAKK